MRYSDDFDDISDLIDQAETCEDAERSIRQSAMLFLTFCSKATMLDVARYINSKMQKEDQDRTLRN